MYVARVRIDGVRGFHGPRKVDLDLTRPDGTYAGWTVIAGRNGSGKTTLLRAIALAVSDFRLGFGLMPEFDDWINHGQEEGEAEIEIINKSAVRLSLHTDWSRDGKAHRRPGHDTAGEFCLAYGPFRRIVGGVRDSSRPSRGPYGRLISLFQDDVSLADGVAWLIDQHTRSLDGSARAERIKQAVLEVLADGLLPDGCRPTKVSADGLWVAYNGTELPLRQMSDGYGVVVGLVIDIIRHIDEEFGVIPAPGKDGAMTVDVPGVVLIDEIDAHLHVSWQQRIGGWLRKHFPRIQFIVTSHSPYVCQAADPNGLIRLPGPVEPEPARVVDQDLYERVVYGSGDDAVLSQLFGVDTPYSPRAEKLREELAALEFLVLDGQATEVQRERYLELQRILTSSLTARMDEVVARFRPEQGGGR